MKKIKAFFANIWNWIKSLFGYEKKESPTPAPAAPAPLMGAALAAELNKQTTPLVGAALTAELDKQIPAASPAPKKTKKVVAKKTTKKKV
jgi:hypothetical protein